MQNTDIQTMDTTANKLEVYSDSIEESISNYCIDHNLKTEDLYKIDQSRWNSVLLYVYKQVFKPTPDNNPNYRYNGKSNIDYSDKELLNSICDIYINFCYEYSKEVSIMGFSKLTGISVDTIYEWLNEGTVERGSSEVAKKLNAEKGGVFKRPFSVWKGKSSWYIGHLKQALWVEYGTAKRAGTEADSPINTRYGPQIWHRSSGSTADPEVPRG